MRNLQRARDAIEEAVYTWKYRPLPKYRKDEFYAIYSQALNGFDSPAKRPCILNDGTLVANDYLRVVVGDYGPWVEFDRSQILTPLPLLPGHEWRLDTEYLERRGLQIKYIARHINGVMVYDQVATVKYADYQVGKIYISTLDFRPIRL